MSNHTSTILQAAKEFKTDIKALYKFLSDTYPDHKSLNPSELLTEEEYDALESKFAKDLAKRRIEQCLASKDTYLDIGSCSLTDADFTEGKELDTLLRQCAHIETLILSNMWWEVNNPDNISSRNKKKSNVFSRLPAAVGFCTNLKKLIAGGYFDPGDKRWMITDLSPLAPLSGLSYLDVSHNQVKKINNLESLTSLQTLMLSANGITTISGLTTLTYLRILDLSANTIVDITGLSSLSSLTELALPSNKITEIKGLESLHALEELHLYNNKITEIKGLETLTSLHLLYLWHNQIKEIKGLESLTKLQILNLGSNNISQMKGIETLVALEQLWLSDNRISKIKGLEYCKALLSLVLSSNKITDIEGLESLTLLEELSLSGNLISEVKGLEKLSRLKTVDLSFNNITQISGLQFIMNLTADLWINVYGNPVIQKYQLQLKPQENDLPFIKELLLRESSASKQKLTYPVKVLLLGNHAAGKSTLVNYFFEAISEGSTHILRIEYYVLPSSDNKKYIPDVVFYDFGGQDFYHGLYQAFINPGCLQIIVFDKKTDRNLSSADSAGQPIFNYNRRYWLGQKRYEEAKNNVAGTATAKADPYIVVQTHADDPAISEASSADYHEFDGFKKSFFLSFAETKKSRQNSNDKFLKAGRDYFTAYFTCEVEKLLAENTREEADWFVAFFYFILNQKKRTYKHTTLTSILPNYGEKQMTDADKLASLQTNLRILHNHGLVLYYFTEELNDVVWLNPAALVDYVQKNILSKKLITDGHPGIVDKKAFDKIVDKRIKQLLILQKVIFLHQPAVEKPEKGEYIIPNYLPLVNDSEPDYQLYTFGLGKPNFIIKFGDFIPFGFINRMICFYGEQPDAKKFWRNQLLFTLHGEARVLIHLDSEQMKVKVYFQMLDKLSYDQKLVGEYLFFSIMALYWDIATRNILSYSDYVTDPEQETKRYESQKESLFADRSKYNVWDKLHISDIFFRSDTYISTDDKRYISYEELFKTDKDDYKIISYGLKETAINKTDRKEIPISTFSFIKKTAVMKNVFISYSHNDIQYRQSLQQFLVNLERDGLIDVWQDGLIQTGELWDKKIKESLRKADICIMLLSQDFIASNYIHETEFRTIMEKRKNENCKIIPVLIKNCDWKNWKVYPPDVLDKLNEKDRIDYAIENFQFLPHDETGRLLPITKFNQPEEAWLQVIEAIKTFCMIL